MKKYYLTILLAFLWIFLSENVSAQIVNIPDANFKAALLAHSPVIDTDGDSEIQLIEAASFTGTLNVSSKNITDLTGIEAFSFITGLNCSSNQLTSINTSTIASLSSLSCFNNKLTNIDLSNNPLLVTLDCNTNLLTVLDLSNNPAIINLNVKQNLLSTFSVSNLLNLNTLNVDFNQLTSIDLSFNTQLGSLEATNNNLTSIDLSNNLQLKNLYIFANQLDSLDVSNNALLEALDCSANQLTWINLDNPALFFLQSITNPLKHLDVSKLPALVVLRFIDAQITTLDLSKNPLLNNLTLDRNKLTTLDLSKNPLLDMLSCGNNQLTSVHVSKNLVLTKMYCSNNKLNALDLSTNSLLSALACDYNDLNYLNVSNGNNTSVSLMNLTFNPNLTCVTVDDPVWSTANWTNKDAQTQFSSGCNCGVFSINIDSLQQVSCLDSAYVQASATGINGPFQYTWLNAPTSLDSIMSTDTAGMYILKVTDLNGCESTRKLVVHAPKVKSGFELNSNLFTNSHFRPGRVSSLKLEAFNDGCDVMQAQLRVVYNGPVTFESSLYPPTQQSGDTLFWDLGDMNYLLDDFLTSLQFRVDTLAQSGDRICLEIQIDPVIGDVDTNNNFKQYCFAVENSFDPNNMQVYPQGVCAEHYTLIDQALTYTVRFQNTGIAPAIDISILDSLSPFLNLNSLRILSASHTQLVTEVLDNSIIKFNFKNINLADSSSNEEASKGYVTFEIQPYANLNEGTQIENKAEIYFDFNAPIITNTVMNTMVSTIPQTSIYDIYDTLTKNYTYDSHKYTKEGVYQRYYYSESGCDSLVLLHLVKPLASEGTDFQISCGFYTWIDGITYVTSNNTATFTIVDGASNGGDSLVRLNLTVNNSTSSTITKLTCGSYTAPDGQVYTTSGTYNALFTNAQGCDSIITINLNISALEVTLIDSFYPNIQILPAYDSVKWYRCENGEIVSTQAECTYVEMWLLAGAVVQLGTCVDSFPCRLYYPEGIDEYLKEKIKLYPNPTSGLFYLDLGQIYQNATIKITDLQGREIKREQVSNQQEIELELNEADGIYLVHVLTENKQAAVLRLVKE